MKRVIVQIFPADNPQPEVADSVSTSAENGNDPEAGIRLEAVLSSERARGVVDAVLNADTGSSEESSSRIIDRLVEQELADDQTGQVFRRVMSKFEKALLERALTECDNIQTRMADRLGVNRNTVRKKLLKHELIRIDEADESIPRHHEECDDN